MVVAVAAAEAAQGRLPPLPSQNLSLLRLPRSRPSLEAEISALVAIKLSILRRRARARTTSNTTSLASCARHVTRRWTARTRYVHAHTHTIRLS